MKTVAYLLAQGEGLRWLDGLKKYPTFLRDAPLHKHLLEINGETILHRSVRLFHENGLDAIVVASPGLLYLGDVQSSGITVPDPGVDVLECMLSLLDLQFIPADITIMAFGDVLFSRAAIKSLANAVKNQAMGCMARVYPNPVCSKVADEVFAMWFARDAQSVVTERIRTMLGDVQSPRPLRPSKPWGSPYAVSPDPKRTQLGYESGQGLKAIQDDLLVVSDYTDDIDSPEEWLQFWPDILVAANADNEEVGNA